MSMDDLYGFENENEKINEMNELNGINEERRQEGGLNISNYDSTNYNGFRQEPVQEESSAYAQSSSDNNTYNSSDVNFTFVENAGSSEVQRDVYEDANNQHIDRGSDTHSTGYADTNAYGMEAVESQHIDSGSDMHSTGYAGTNAYGMEAVENQHTESGNTVYGIQNTYPTENNNSGFNYLEQEEAHTDNTVASAENNRENYAYNNAFEYSNQGTYEQTQNNAGYTQTDEADNVNNQAYKEEAKEGVRREPGRSRKRGSGFRRVAGITAAALLFGTVAGGTMFGVNNLANSVFKTEESSTEAKVAQVSSVELKEANTAVNTTNSSSPTVADVSPIAESAMPSVVAIKGTTSVEAYSWFGEGQTYETPSSGSGIIIGKNDTELLVVTNNHVVEDTKDLSVVFIDDEEVNASVKGRDSENDIAIMAVKLEDIKPETLEKIAVAHMGDSDELKVGQGVVAIGNALGYGQSVTVGYLSAIDREVRTKDSSIKSLLQTDAAINPGNSGGALLNMSGEVIGINVAKYSSTEVEGMGYAIPISKVKDIISELSSKETRSNRVDEANQGYLGIQGKNIDEDVAEAYDMPRGIYVYKIVENSAAADSGLREKDIITKIDSQSVKTMEDLKDMLSYYKSGEKIKVTVQRLGDSEYEEKEIEITLSDRSALQ